VKTPVVTLSEISAQYRFGARQAVKMVVLGAMALLTLFLVLHFGNHIISFLVREGTTWRILATACVVVFVPTFAFLYGSAAGLFLRLIKLD
jgi:hypothetical protein